MKAEEDKERLEVILNNNLSFPSTVEVIRTANAIYDAGYRLSPLPSQELLLTEVEEGLSGIGVSTEYILLKVQQALLLGKEGK